MDEMTSFCWQISNFVDILRVRRSNLEFTIEHVRKLVHNFCHTDLQKKNNIPLERELNLEFHTKTEECNSELWIKNYVRLKSDS